MYFALQCTVLYLMFLNFTVLCSLYFSLSNFSTQEPDTHNIGCHVAYDNLHKWNSLCTIGTQTMRIVKVEELSQLKGVVRKELCGKSCEASVVMSYDKKVSQISTHCLLINSIHIYIYITQRPLVTISTGRQVENRFCTVLYRFLHLLSRPGRAAFPFS